MKLWNHLFTHQTITEFHVVAEICMPLALRIQQAGGPEVLSWTAVDLEELGSDQVRLRQAAAGLNYIDVYHRTGYDPQPLPLIPGLEGAGTVEAVAPDVRGLKVGDRVAYAGPHRGRSFCAQGYC
jgi:NADPH2:quinone reductase